MSTTKDTRPYITISNELFRHPKFRRLSDKAKLWLLELWAYCNEYRTDGFVDVHILNEKGAKITAELMVNFVETTADNDMFYMHDYLDHQPSRKEIEDRIQEKRSRASTGGKLSAHNRHHVKKGIVNPDCELCPDA